LSGGDEASQVVGIENDGLLELSVEAVALDAEAVVVVEKLLKLSAELGSFNGLKDGGGIAVKCLTRGARAGSLAGDGTVRAIEDGGGVGDAKRRR
jgi:hypothetical protein